MSNIYMYTKTMRDNVYGDPTTDTNAARNIDRLAAQVENIHNRFLVIHTIMGGDFNFALFDEDRRTTSRKIRSEAKFATLVSTYELIDTAIICSDLYPRHTYFRHRMPGVSARYDRIYVTANLVPGITYATLRRTNDHAPIRISILEQRKGIKQWRFQDELLLEESFISKMKETLKTAMSEYINGVNEQNISKIQDYIDFDTHRSTNILSNIIDTVRSMAREETKKRREERLKNEREALDQLIQKRQRYNETPNPSDAHTTDLEEAQMKLRQLQTIRAQKASVNNYINYAINGERTTAYHFSMMNKGRASRDIRKLIIGPPEDTRSIENEEIVRHMTDKYTKIAEPDPIAGTMTIEEFLGEDLVTSCRKCPQEEYEQLVAPFTTDELKPIVKGIKNKSSPGPLGITNQLLKVLFPYISRILVKMGNDVMFGDEIPDIPAWLFHRIVIFIMKPGKATTDENSYRGLSMLENIFKMYSKAIATRTAGPLRHIQNPHQFGFM